MELRKGYFQLELAPDRVGRFPWLLIRNKQITCVMRLLCAAIIPVIGLWVPLIFLARYEDSTAERGGMLFGMLFPIYIFAAAGGLVTWLDLRQRLKIDGFSRFRGIGILGVLLLVISASPVWVCGAILLVSIVAN
ncbi:MAG: hypothetical protein LBM04_10875 [Opitutaceae bacterium]|jgi:hypothetical protein|nr:hypothetical protein [Opitutaceae bacterium]